MQLPFPVNEFGEVDDRLRYRDQRLIDIRILVLRGELARYRRLQMRALEQLRNLGVEL